MPQIDPVIASLGTSLVVAVVTAILTVQLSLRRFQAERWWERKVDAYSRIIEALHHVIAFTWMNLEQIHENAYFSQEDEAEIKSSYSKAQRDLHLAIDLGAYIISDEVAKILTELRSSPKKEDKDEQDEENPGYEHLKMLESDFDRYPKALAKIRVLARRDLKVR